MPFFFASIVLPDPEVAPNLEMAIIDFLDAEEIDYQIIGMRVSESNDYAVSPKARATDPDTSKEAAIAVLPRRGIQKDMLLEAVCEAESRGLTADEAAEKTGIRLNTASTRMSDLVDDGFIKDNGERRETSGGRQAIVYVADISAIRRASRK